MNLREIYQRIISISDDIKELSSESGIGDYNLIALLAPTELHRIKEELRGTIQPSTEEEILVCPQCKATSKDHDIVIDYEYKATVLAVYYANADDGCVVRGEVKIDGEVDEDTIFAECQPLARCTACGKSGMKFGEIIVKRI